MPGHGADLDAALDGRDDDVPVVLLAHQPYMVEQAQAAGVDLQLSGHTHGGQLWPFDYVIRLDQPAVEGLSRHGDTQLYVTAGAGYWGPPMRVGARPEVTVVELRAPRSQGAGGRFPLSLLQRVERLLDELLELALAVAVGPGEQAGRVGGHVGVDDDRVRRPRAPPGSVGSASATTPPLVRSNSAARVRRAGVAATIRQRASASSRNSGVHVPSHCGTARRIRSDSGRSAGWPARSAAKSCAVGNGMIMCSLDG